MFGHAFRDISCQGTKRAAQAKLFGEFQSSHLLIMCWSRSSVHNVHTLLMFEIGLLFLDAFGIFWCVKPDAIYNISIQYKLHKHSEILSRSGVSRLDSENATTRTPAGTCVVLCNFAWKLSSETKASLGLVLGYFLKSFGNPKSKPLQDFSKAFPKTA